MKHNHTSETTGQAKLPAAQTIFRATMRSFFAGRVGILGCAALLLATIGSASAQTTYTNNITNSITVVNATVTNMLVSSTTTSKPRLTIPVNTTGQLSPAVWGATNTSLGMNITNQATTNFTTSLNVRMSGATTIVSVTNVIGLDTYITNTYDIVQSVASVGVTGVPAGAGVVVPMTMITNSGTGMATITVPVTLFYTNVASGIYDMAVEVTGANIYRYPLPVIAGYQWTTNAATVANGTNFAAAGNWLGEVAPSATTDIVILENIGSSTTLTNPTVRIESDIEIGALNDIHNANNTHFAIASGATLKITGPGGFQQLSDLYPGNGGTIVASGAGGILVSNENATFLGGSSGTPMRFNSLSNLTVNVAKMAFGDIVAYPLIRTNGIINSPSSAYEVQLAQTNVLRATQTDPNNWTNDFRQYSFVVSRTGLGGSSRLGGGVRFGRWNELYMDSILFGGYANATMGQFITTNSYLKIAGPNYTDRCRNVTIGDKLNPMNTNLEVTANSTATVTFVNGTSDALIDTLILARNARFVANAAAGAVLTLGLGTWDVNNVILGYQTGACDGTEGGGANGTMTVNGGIFKVNDTMTLGWTETNSGPVIYSSSDVSYGRFTVQSNGTALINKIEVGGPKNVSYRNYVTVTGAGTSLVLSNSMGGLTNRVSRLDVRGGATLALPGVTAPGVTKVFATVVQGADGVISLPNVTASGTYNVASFESLPTITWTLTLPPGLYGFLTIDESEKLIKAVVSSSPPKTCVWVGNVSSDWDTTTLNWKELVSGNPTNFVQGDAVRFDDSASSAAVNIVQNVIPAGGTTITNDTLNYSFSGQNIEGTAATVKTGAGTVTYNNIHLPSMTVSTNGSLVVNGELRGGLIHRGISAINNGIILGSVSLQNTNAFLVNNGTITTTPGALSLGAGTILTNSLGATINNGSSSTTTTPLGSLVVNQGQINNLTARIEANGVWISDGGIVTDLGATSEALLAAGNGRFGIQTTGELYIRGAGDINYMQVEARFDTQAGARVYVDLDRAASPNCDHVKVDYFGNMRGTFVMNNIGATPFANGDVFTLLRQTYELSRTNSTAADRPKVSPPAAKVGFTWDVTGMLATTTTPPASAVRTVTVVPVSTTPPPTMVATNSMNTNTMVRSLVISWPSTNTSYQLQAQTNELTVGLSTNWFPVVGSEQTNVWTIPVTGSTNPSVFYRLSNQ